MQYTLPLVGLVFLSSCVVGVKVKKSAALSDRGIVLRNSVCSVFIRKEVIIAKARQIHDKRNTNLHDKQELEKQIIECEKDTSRLVTIDVDERWKDTVSNIKSLNSSYKLLHYYWIDLALLKNGDIKIIDNVSGVMIKKYYYKKHKHGGYLSYDFLLKNGAVFYDRSVSIE